MTIFCNVINDKLFFKIIFPIEQQRFIEIPEGRSIIGRGLSADIRLNDELVSREHCEIFNNTQVIHLRDLHSTNGSFINFTEQSEAVLQNGDQLQIGATILKVVIQASADITETFSAHNIFSQEHFITCSKSFLKFAARNNTSISVIDLIINPNANISLPKTLALKFSSLINNVKSRTHLLYSPTPLHFKILLSGISEKETETEAATFADALNEHKFFWNDSPISLECSYKIQYFNSIKTDLEQVQILKSLEESC